MRWLSVALLLLCVGCTYRIPFGAVEPVSHHGWNRMTVHIPGHLMRRDPEDI